MAFARMRILTIKICFWVGLLRYIFRCYAQQNTFLHRLSWQRVWIHQVGKHSYGSTGEYKCMASRLQCVVVQH